jgi:hypothetical protein
MIKLDDTAKKELQELSNQIESQLYEEPTMKIVDILSDPEKTTMFTELSETEIKLLTRIAGLAEAFDDDIKREVVRKFILFKVSGGRKGRTGIEGIARHSAMAEVFDKMGMGENKPGLFSRVKGKLGMG